MKKVFLAIFIIGGLAFAAELIRDAYFLFSPNSTDPSFKIILIEPGPFAKTAEFLHKEGLIKDPRRFAVLARIFRFASNVRVGEYEVRMNMSPYQLLRVLVSGKSVLHAIVIPEGYDIDQIADVLTGHHLVTRQSFIQSARDSKMAKLLGINEPTLEGFLYPDTYSFTHFTGERVILKTMVDKFKEVYDREVKFGAEKQGMSMHDVVTLGSMIEKETGAPEERPIISSVFHNRLKLNMMLQSDPTVIYGKNGDKKNITKEDLHRNTPYNTYTRHGLPVGPIASPGKESMIAAIEPADTKYLYFVSRNNGTHYFSGTYSEHSRAVNKFQVDPKARKGKSWRDHNKKKSQANNGQSKKTE